MYYDITYNVCTHLKTETNWFKLIQTDHVTEIKHSDWLEDPLIGQLTVKLYSMTLNMTTNYHGNITIYHGDITIYHGNIREH